MKVTVGDTALIPDPYALPETERFMPWAKESIVNVGIENIC